jgi:hypothetical protein
VSAASQEPLPAAVPLFPLKGVLLLPHGSLPLHIYEPRYLAMLEDAAAGERFIGMIQPADSDDEAENPVFYSTGCVGRITKESEAADGRRYITLTGVSRFDLVDELPLTRGYRRANVSYDRFRADVGPQELEQIEAAPLLDAVETYFGVRGFAADWDAMRKLPGEALVNLVAMMCPFGPAEKQALLEALTLGDRTQVLAALLNLNSQPFETAARMQ